MTVGRQHLLTTLSEGVCAHRSFAVCGGPRMGKSFIAARLSETLVQRWRQRPSEAKLVAVRVDARELVQRRQPAAAALWEGLTAAICDPYVTAGAPLPNVPQFRPRPRDDAWQLFDACGDELWHLLQGTDAWCRYALIVDNMDAALREENEPTGLLQEVERYLSTSVPWYPSAVVALGGSVLRERTRQLGSALRGLRCLVLGNLGEAEVRTLAHEVLGEVAAITHGDRVLALTGGHPALLHDLLTALREQGDASDLEQALAATRERREALFTELWQVLEHGHSVPFRGGYTTLEHVLFQALLRSPEPVALRRMEKELRMRHLREHAEALELLGIVTRELKGDYVHLRAPVGLWNAWYRERERT